MSYSNDKNNSAEMHRTTSRLYQRLKRLGFHLQSGQTVPPNGRRMIRLKRTDPVQRGFRITDGVTGEVVSGERFELTVWDVEKFWTDKKTQQAKAKRKAAAQEQRERYKPRMRSRDLEVDTDTMDNENEIDLSFDWESSERFFDD